MRKPWYRKGRGYYLELETGKQVKLGDTEEEAHDKWDELRHAAIDGDDPLMEAIAESFLESVATTKSESTLAWYTNYVAAFASLHQGKTVGDLKRRHLTEWVEASFTSPSSRSAAIRSIKRCFQWAVEQEHLKLNPFSGVKAPSIGRREVLVSEDTHTRIINEIGNARHRRPFRLVLIALRISGCRPQELASLTAESYVPDIRAWVLPKHKTVKRTQRPRVIRMCACLDAIRRILTHARPSGPLFLNADKNPWKRQAIVSRMDRLRKKLDLPAGTVAYSYRHGYITDALMNGVDIATVAELAGHSSAAMITRHYAHLDQRGEHLAASAQKARTRRAAET